MSAGRAWYFASRSEFLVAPRQQVVGFLASAAGRDGWHIEPEQHQEWLSSVDMLQRQLARKVEILRDALADPGLSDYSTVVLEFDLRRRGLRIDCVLLGRGVIAVLEFKRSPLQKADLDQVENYCVNLLEFHAETRRLCATDAFIVVPIVVQTEGAARRPLRRLDGFMPAPWDHIARPTLATSHAELAEALHEALRVRRGAKEAGVEAWLAAPFSPSSTILDAALSLYGQHDVSAIGEHAAPVEWIARCTDSVLDWIRRSREDGHNRVVFVSGAPGSGKTLLGLQIAFHPELREDAVFVTGNAPLVDVLSAALKASYRRGSRRAGLAGYPREAAKHVIDNATFKIVKAHAFLGERGGDIGATDGRIVVFDEAQRTYEKGRQVLRKALEDDEAALILRSMEGTYGSGCVVVALLGHNQFINSGEVGSGAWIHAAQRMRWRCVVAEETLELFRPAERKVLHEPGLLERLEAGHLRQSLRYYRNLHVEEWVAAALDSHATQAAGIARLFKEEDTIWLTRRLADAKAWVRGRRVGEERTGIVGSGKGGRLAAEGLFVGLKPSISDWMLQPDGDIRSSNTLETVQNQYQVQGLEIDYAIVCWDLDLRRGDIGWTAHALSGAKWQRQANALEIAVNGYRVLLTRSRKGMVVFVPAGDPTGLDETRPPEAYDAVADYLAACGARELPTPWSRPG